MTEETQQKDYFWLYVAGIAALAIGTLLMVKQNETEKFDPIRKQVNEELRLMNIRVLK
jgi:hypothetical protein